MRIIACNLAGSLALLAVLTAQSQSASTGQPDARHIAQLIDQLGSKKFQERELAARELDVAGPAALEPLQKATHHQDPEISRRAESLAQRIQKRIETAQVLEPKRVHLHYQDTPLDEAVTDFSGKTGFTLNLRSGGRDRRITLDTGEATFWQALDQFCKKADLMEQSVGHYTPPAGQEMRIINGRPGAGQVALIVSSSNYPAAQVSYDGPLHLTFGKPQSLPTFYAGAVRIRALSANELPRSGLAQGETGVALEVTPQPKMGWQSVLGIQVERAVDEHDQVLASVTDSNVILPELAGRMGNRALLLEAENARLRQTLDTRKIPLKFKLADKPSKTLKELRGVLNAQVQTPRQPLMTINDVLKSAGKTIKGPDGRAITVTEVSSGTDGSIKMRISLEELQAGNFAVNRRLVMRANRVVARNGAVMGGGIMRETGIPGESKLALLDAQGRGFGLDVNAYAVAIRGNAVVQDLQMTFQPRAGQTEPAKFVYSDHRTLNIEIPFVLKDVPLPVK